MSNKPFEILTFGGIAIDPFDARPEQIDIRDIAHSLSLLCRANGHIARFYSVAQHCLNCEQEAVARSLGERVRLFCLLHDATECYISDLVRPVKRRLPEYVAGEGRLLHTIFTALNVGLPTEEEWRLVTEIDDALLYHEFVALRDVRIADREPPLMSAPSLSFRDPHAVELQYLLCYHEALGDDGHKADENQCAAHS